MKSRKAEPKVGGRGVNLVGQPDCKISVVLDDYPTGCEKNGLFTVTLNGIKI